MGGWGVLCAAFGWATLDGMRIKYAVIGVGVVVVVVAGYYALSPLFVHVRVDEAVPQATQSPQDAPAASVAAAVEGTLGHPASGTVRIVRADGRVYLRYENFKTINGPDLYVYLAKNPDAKEFVNLGRIRATEGNVNYEIPEGVDPRDYPYALTWCKAFSVLFNSAKLY